MEAIPLVNDASTQERIAIVDLADDLQVRKQRIFKILLRLDIHPTQRREPNRRNQNVVTVSSSEAAAIRAEIVKSSDASATGSSPPPGSAAVFSSDDVMTARVRSRTFDRVVLALPVATLACLVASGRFIAYWRLLWPPHEPAPGEFKSAFLTALLWIGAVSPLLFAAWENPPRTHGRPPARLRVAGRPPRGAAPRFRSRANTFGFSRIRQGATG
jgi:hypothetical protein